MKAASLKELKSAWENLTHSEINEVLLRLIKYKKENKELLNYLLFEAQNETEYIDHVKEEIDDLFTQLNTKNLYIAKKNIRKIIRVANKYIKYSAIKTTEIAIYLHLVMKIKSAGIDLSKSVVLSNLYLNLIKKIEMAISTFHEDLQYDFKKSMENMLISS